jgi:hypothetical protein
MLKQYFLLTLFVNLFFSCKEEENVIDQPAPPVAVDSTLTVDLSGYVQKGPFINGTAITVSELDNKLVTTGKNFATQIADNKGTFSLKGIKLKSNFVQLQADGFYFDEVKGEKSAAQLTLFALSDVEDITSINANLLSHMERTRVMYLMQEEEKSFVDAKQQALQEILTVFGIEKEDIQHSEVLDISQDGDDHAILLAISVVLQANNSVAELSELVANIMTDLREDGELNSESNQKKIREQSMFLDLPQIRSNLEQRYEEMGVEAIIPNFEQYIDSDGDGILNKDDDNLPDEFVFAAIENAERNKIYLSELIKVSGLPYPAIAQISEGELIVNGANVGQDTAYVSDGDKLQIKVITPLDWGTQISSLLKVGDYQTSFTVSNEAYPWATAISGYLQAGPFSNGASFTLIQLDSGLNKTEKTFSTQTINSQGAYQKGEIELDYSWAVAEAKGYYYDFINKKTSESELQLIAYTDLSANNEINVNVLTYLEAPRVKYLVNSGIGFAAAKQQAQQEVLAVFEIQEDISTHSEHFDITQNNTEGAILLAISAILQGYESTGTLQELLRNISEDLETDGSLENPVLGSALINNAVYLDLGAIRTAVSNKYIEIGKSITVPNFENWVNCFTNNTAFILTKNISYPIEGKYGINLLSEENSQNIEKTTQSYSMSSLVPEGGKLKVILKGTTQYGWSIAFAPQSPENWIISPYDKVAKKQEFEIIESEKQSHLMITFQNKQSVTIEFYENGSSTPFTRTINVL